MKTYLNILLVLLMLLTIPVSKASAQCTLENHAFTGSEAVNYNLYFNWQFIWVKAGTASLVTTPIVYNGKKSYRSSLVTKSSSTVDRYFMMRDTIMAYFTQGMAPLYYRKGAREGKRYYVDEVWYSYPNGNCHVKQRHLNNDRTVTNEQFTYTHCVSDMLNSFMRVRNMDPSSWKVGHTEYIDITGGNSLTKAKLVYRGKKEVKADNKKKYTCLVLSYIEKEKKKDKEIVRFYVTDDHRHLPIRLDLFLRFGSAKAFLSSAQ